ncbi:calcium-binding protein [Pseudovibrio denitrificans]|uniref:calcium-binding protein n=1 Tax=Pseudovibrio denitrificans TaxID=258256 RepID=UPI0006D29A64|nr:calcium-binding protein [Pseudovibrio denitrificans]
MTKSLRPLLAAETKVRFEAGVNPEDVSWARGQNGRDLIITLSDGSTLTIKDQFYADNFGNSLNQIESFEFSNGTTLGVAAVQQKLLVSTTGDDSILGFVGNDVLDGGQGDDYLSGGNGADTYVFGLGYGNDTVDDKVTSSFAGAGDKVRFEAGVNPEDVSWTRSQNGRDLIITLSDGSTLTIKDQFYADNFGNSLNQIESFEFSNGTTLSVAEIQLKLLQSTTGDDTILGFAGNDVLDGGLGDDQLIGQAGNDTYIYRLGDGKDVIRDDSYGGYADKLVLGEGILPDEVTVVRSSDNINDATLHFKDGSTITIIGQFNAAPQGGLEQITFTDGTVWTEHDLIALSLKATTGDDRLVGSYQPDTIKGGKGNDYIFGSRGADKLYGEEGNDQLLGGAGADLLDGGAGDDSLDGGANDDTYIWGSGYGNDVITEDSGNGSDTLQLTDLNADDVVLTQSLENPRDLIITIKATGEAVKLVRTYHTNGAVGLEGVNFLQFADGTIWDQNTMRANAILAGTDAADTITGDNVYGEVIDGGSGDDIINGSGGDDVYLWGSGDGNDVITEEATKAQIRFS